MVWYNLKIGSWNLKYTPLNPIEKEYPYCDSKGNILKKISGKFEKGYFINEATGEKFDTAFRLINEKPFAKLQKTKEVSNYKEVEFNEVEDIIQERICLAENDDLLNELEETGKALKFGFSNGNGYKAYKTYLFPSKLYKGFLFMVMGTTNKSELINDIITNKEHKKKAESVMKVVQGIERASAEQLLEI